MQSAADPALELPHTGGCKTVYVIDDDVAVRRSFHFLLLTAGYTCWPFSSAVDFLDNLVKLRPAPIILDIRMPDVDGMELMKILSDGNIRWPIIAMTAHGNVPIAVQAMKLGACEFLEKPFEFGLLETALQLAFVQLSQSVTTTLPIRPPATTETKSIAKKS